MDLATLALVAVFTRDLVAEPTPALVAALIPDPAAEPILALVAVLTRGLVAEPTPGLVEALTPDPAAALIRDLAAEPTPALVAAVIPGLAAEVMTRGTVPLPTVADVSVLSYRPNDTALSWESETALCSRN